MRVVFAPEVEEDLYGLIKILVGVFGYLSFCYFLCRRTDS